MKRLGVAGLAILAFSVAASGGSSSSSSFPGKNGLILFSGEERFLLDESGKRRVELPRLLREAYELSYSPDGAKVAFTYLRSAGVEMYVIDLPRGRPRLVDKRAPEQYGLAWSPDASLLLFTRRNASGSYQLRITPVAGGRSRTLTRPGQGESDEGASWSPRGDRIAFLRRRGSTTQLRSVRPDGAQGKVVSARAGIAGTPSWSPDGHRIAFRADGPGGGDIYLANTKGGGEQLVVTSPYPEWAPLWSPDGTTLAFRRTRASEGSALRYQTMLADPDGRNERRLLVHGSVDPIEWLPRCHAAGGDRRDRLVISTPKALACGRGGNDLLVGNSAGGVLIGGDGDDILRTQRATLVFGSAGADRIEAQNGHIDQISCGPGRDEISAEPRDLVRSDCERVRRCERGSCQAQATVGARRSLVQHSDPRARPADGSSSFSPNSSKATAKPGKPPRPPTDVSPPPAWVSTPRGDRWLAYGVQRRDRRPCRFRACSRLGV